MSLATQEIKKNEDPSLEEKVVKHKIKDLYINLEKGNYVIFKYSKSDITIQQYKILVLK